MFSWLRSKLFRAEHGGSPANVAVSLPKTQPIAREEAPSNEPPVVPLEAAYRDLLFGVTEQLVGRPRQAEAELLKRIDAIFSSPSSAKDMVPRLPAILPRVMKSLRDEDTSAKDIADQIRRDATMVAEVVRLANSPYYRTRQQITSLEHATFALGRDGLRQLIANVAFRPVFNDRSGQYSKHARPLVWDQAERSAAAAKGLAAESGDDEFDAYLAGLVHSIGMTIVMRLMDNHYSANFGVTAPEFCDVLLLRARRLSTLVVRSWEFPATVVAAIEEQSTKSDSADMASLGRVLWTANRLSTIRVLMNRGIVQSADDLLSAYFPSDRLRSAERCFKTLEAFDQTNPD